MSFSVFRRAGRPYYEVQWTDATGRLRTKSTGTAIEREAHRFAARLNREAGGKTLWSDVKRDFLADKVEHLKRSSKKNITAALLRIDQVVKPTYVQDITNQAILKIKKAIRKDRGGEFCIRNNLVVIRRILRWANKNGLLAEVPDFEVPTPSGVRGRALSDEEFTRLVAACPLVVGKAAPSWEFLLRGLWWSGLRIDEAHRLHWSDLYSSDQPLIRVRLDLEYPYLEIPPKGDKSGKYRLCPMAPEFLELLQGIPEEQRTGFVFNPEHRKSNRGERLSCTWVSRTIAAIGRKAGIWVKDGVSASAHDLRRSFGLRWSHRVLEKELMELMRHESITTTMKYYANRNSRRTAEAVFQAYSCIETQASRNGQHKKRKAAITNESTNSESKD